ASAQYPPPQTNLVCAVSQVDLNAGSNVLLAATLRDASGTAMSGQAVAFSVVTGDAKLSSASVATDADGTAVVNVNIGANPGNVVLSAKSGSVECRATAQVNNIRPPSTGDAGLAASKHDSSSPLTALTIATGLILSLGLVARRTANHEA
ncbi:MAG TPA: Ig-like domain-containing protein, partial [Dehalococcoidia bacterium]|nr:Ig-like domain-containing protein [Dehalococcoidia bacterium]